VKTLNGTKAKVQSVSGGTHKRRTNRMNNLPRNPVKIDCMMAELTFDMYKELMPNRKERKSEISKYILENYNEAEINQQLTFLKDDHTISCVLPIEFMDALQELNLTINQCMYIVSHIFEYDFDSYIEGWELSSDWTYYQYDEITVDKEVYIQLQSQLEAWEAEKQARGIDVDISEVFLRAMYRYIFEWGGQIGKKVRFTQVLNPVASKKFLDEIEPMFPTRCQAVINIVHQFIRDKKYGDWEYNP
jgi:hypothetical protein